MKLVPGIGRPANKRDTPTRFPASPLGAAAEGGVGDNRSEGWEYSSNPKTIWALPEELRLQAVKDMFSRMAQEYLDAVDRDDAKAAQEAAAGALHTVAGLFPDGSDPSHHLVHSIVGAIVAARNGATRPRKRRSGKSPPVHILLRPGARVPGTKNGYGDAHIKGFAVAATLVLRERGMSDGAARDKVAKILFDLGISRRDGDDAQAKAVTRSALRRWEEETEENPIPAGVAPAIKLTIEKDIVANNRTTLSEIEELIADHANAFVPRARAY